MAVSANLFVTDSLVGSTSVKNAFANVSVATRPLAFIGDQSFVVKLRRNSTEGDVIATTPQITIRDNAALVSFIANTNTVAEGDLVEFTLTTTGAANNAVLYYSTLAVTPNVDVQDFFGANAGSFTLVDNVGTIVLRANADSSLTDEAGETFKLQIRTGSVTGNVLVTSSNVIISDTSKVSFYTLTQDKISVLVTQNVTFSIITTNVSNNYLLYYRTSGNVISTDFVQGNTGSFAVVNNAANLTLTANAILAEGEERVFALQILEGAVNGNVILESNTITVIPIPPPVSATGGTVIDDGGYRIHTFDSSSNLVVSQGGQVEYLVVAGGGGGGSYGAGGGGGVRQGSLSVTSNENYTILVGAGGGGGKGYVGQPAPGVIFSTSGQNSEFSTIISHGGGYGGIESQVGSPGGSGGSAGAFGAAGVGNDPPFSPPQGFPGGASLPAPAFDYFSGGGGGASQAGANATPTISGKGGDGAPSLITNANVIYGGGGGGGSFPQNSIGQAPGGAGGGGPGGRRSTPPLGGSGAPGLGGGGGGGASYESPGGAGGGGIVIIRYPIA